MTAISPWDRGAVAYLRPGPGRAIILLDYHLPLDVAMRDTVPALERTLAERVHPPVEAIQSGYASVSRALQKESLSATERAELIAAPLLLIVLLLVFRSVMAAAIPLAFGALTVIAGRGILVLLDSVMTIEALSVVVCTMMGLALGVDYSLFIVSRFRDELAAGASPWQAAMTTRRTAGRTTLFAGATLFTSILLSSFLQPGSLLLSLATGLVVVTPISVAIAWIALPALLALLGERINMGAIGNRAPARPGSRVAAIADSALRRPAVAAALIAVPLLLLAVPALAFNTGAPGVNELPKSSPARQSAEAIDRAVGPGWEAPFEIVVAAREGPITTQHRLALLVRAQRRIAARPEVRAVIGPAPIQRAVRPLHGLGRRLASSGPAGPTHLSDLGPGLRRAAAAVARLRAGLSRAASGSGLLGEGSERAGAGAGLLADGLERAAAGGSRASEALGRLATGSGRLAEGQREASNAGLALEVELHALVPSLRSKALRRARRVANELEAAAKSDPSLRGVAKQERLLARVLAVRARQGAGHAGSRDRAARCAQRARRRRHPARKRDAPPCGQGRRAEGRPRAAQLRRASALRRARRPQRRRRGAAARALKRLTAAPTRCSGGSGARGSASAPPRVRLLAARANCVAARPLSSTPATSSSPRSTERRRFPAASRGRRSTWGGVDRPRGCSSSPPTPSTRPVRGPRASSSTTKPSACRAKATW